MVFLDGTVRSPGLGVLPSTATVREAILWDRTVLSRYPLLDSEKVTKTEGWCHEDRGGHSDQG